VVRSKPPFGGPEYVLQYLGRYTHRVAISNHRLVSFAEGKVTFRWRDYSTDPLRASARSVSLCLAVLQTGPFYFLKSSLRESLALSLPFHLPLSSVVLCRTASAHPDPTPSLN
jgi:hypothetical protein